jgi:hypothetical protein
MVSPAGRKWAKARKCTLGLPEAWEDHRWSEESYRNVAPKKLVAQLPNRRWLVI